MHAALPVLLASALAGLGVYALIARRHAVMVLIGAELLLNSANVLLVTASAMPAAAPGWVAAPDRAAALDSGAGAGGAGAGGAGAGGAGAGGAGAGGAGAGGLDPLLGGQSLTLFVITIAAAEIGLALAIVLLLFRQRATSDLTQATDLGEARR